MPLAIEDATVLNTTDSAILVDAPTLDEPEWIPQSQIHDDSEVWRKNDEGTLVITDWIAKQKGWD